MWNETAVDAIGLIFIPLLFGVITAVVWFFQTKKKELTDRCDSADARCEKFEDALNALKLHVAEEYLKKDDFRESLKEIKDNFATLFKKIDKLVELKEDKK